MVIDAKEGVTEQDAKIAGIAHERGKGIIIVVNKWDAIDKTDKTIYEYTNKIKTVLSFIPYAEFVFVSALTGQRMNKLFEMIDMVRENQTLRIATGVLNEILAEAVALNMADSTDAKLQTLTELFKGKTGTEWLGYNRLFESNLRRASED